VRYGTIHNMINPTWDIALLLFLISAGFFFALTKGKHSLKLIILALYVMSVLFTFIPLGFLTDGRSLIEVWMIKSGTFFIFSLLLAFLLTKKCIIPVKRGLWWEILILSVLATGFLMTSLFSIAPAELASLNFLNFSPFVFKLFTDAIFIQWWIILPILGVIFL